MEKRIVYKIENGEREEIKFEDIKKGMLIELYDDENTQDKNRNCQFLADSDAFKNNKGIWTFQALEKH